MWKKNFKLLKEEDRMMIAKGWENGGNREMLVKGYKASVWKMIKDFPGSPVVKNPPANAEDGFNPWSGKIPHATEQLSPWATTTEPAF